MKVTFNETQYEFKNFWSETNGHEVHLFRNGKIVNITPLHQLPPPYMMFDMYVGLMKKHIEFDSIKVTKK